MSDQRLDSRRDRSSILSIGTALLLVASVVVLLGTRAIGHDLGPSVPGEDVVYAEGTSNLRRCPRTSCEIVATTSANQQLVVRQHVDGEDVRGSNDWLEIEQGSSSVFIHSSLVVPPGSGFGPLLELVLSIGALVVAGLVGVVGRSERMAQLAANADPSRLDTGLYGIAIVGGVVAGSIGFALASLDGQSLLSFWSSAFVNLGAGLVGAAIAFVLFQRLIRRRSDPIDDLQAEVARLRSVIESQAVSVKAAAVQGASQSKGWRAAIRRLRGC